MLAREQLARVLETEAGRSWFEQRFRVDTELYAIGQTLLQTDTDCRDRYSRAAAEVDRSFIESQRNAVDARSA